MLKSHPIIYLQSFGSIFISIYHNYLIGGNIGCINTCKPYTPPFIIFNFIHTTLLLHRDLLMVTNLANLLAIRILTLHLPAVFEFNQLRSWGAISRIQTVYPDISLLSKFSNIIFFSLCSWIITMSSFRDRVSRNLLYFVMLFWSLWPEILWIMILYFILRLCRHHIFSPFIGKGCLHSTYSFV